MYQLYGKLSIENWILPAAFLGIIDFVVWVTPPWSNQIPPGRHDFTIGRNKNTNEVMLSCLENYFISEGLICDPNDLVDCRTVTLVVFKLSTESEIVKNDIAMLKEMIADKTLILDIDMDFYSTRNPFLSLYSEIGLYQTLKQVYTFDPVPSGVIGADRLKLALDSSQRRRELLSSLDSLTNHLSMGGPLNAYEGPGAEFVQQFSQIQKSIQQSSGKADRIDWKLIHDAGSTCDDTDLPHHVSSGEEISILLTRTQQFIHMLGMMPSVITMSRSALDEFCPENQVEMIQSQLLELVQNFVGGSDKVDINLGYQDMDE